MSLIGSNHHEEQLQNQQEGNINTSNNHEEHSLSNDNADGSASQSGTGIQHAVPQHQTNGHKNGQHDRSDGTAAAAGKPMLTLPSSPSNEQLVMSGATIPPLNPPSCVNGSTIHQDLPDPQPPPSDAPSIDVPNQTIACSTPQQEVSLLISECPDEYDDEQDPSIPASSIPKTSDAVSAASTIGNPSVDTSSSTWLGGWLTAFRGPTADKSANDDMSGSDNDRSIIVTEGRSDGGNGETASEDAEEIPSSPAVGVKRLFVGGIEDMNAPAESSEKVAEAGDSVDHQDPEQTSQEDEQQDRVVELELLVNSISQEKTHLEEVIGQLSKTLTKVSEDLQTSKRQEQSWKEQYELSTRSLHDSKSRLDSFEKDVELKNAEFQKLIMSTSMSSHSSGGVIRNERDESERDGEDAESFQNAEIDEGNGSNVLQEEQELSSTSTHQTQIRQLQDELHQTKHQVEELQDLLLETKGQVTTVSKEKSAINATLVKTRWKMANVLVLLNEKNAALEQRVQSLLEEKERDNIDETPPNASKRLVTTSRRDSARSLGSSSSFSRARELLAEHYEHRSSLLSASSIPSEVDNFNDSIASLIPPTIAELDEEEWVEAENDAANESQPPQLRGRGPQPEQDDDHMLAACRSGFDGAKVKNSPLIGTGSDGTEGRNRRYEQLQTYVLELESEFSGARVKDSPVPDSKSESRETWKHRFEQMQRYVQELEHSHGTYERLLEESEYRLMRVSVHMKHQEEYVTRLTKQRQQVHRPGREQQNAGAATVDSEQQHKEMVQITSDFEAERLEFKRHIGTLQLGVESSKPMAQELERILEDSQGGTIRVTQHAGNREDEYKRTERSPRNLVVDKEQHSNTLSEDRTVETMKEPTDGGHPLAEQLHQRELECTRLRDDKSHLESEVKAISARLEEQQGKAIGQLAELEADLVAAEDQIAILESENDKLRVECKTVATALEEMKSISPGPSEKDDIITQLESKISVLSYSLQESRQDVTATTEEKSTLEERVNQLQSFVDNATSQMTEMEQQLLSSNEEVSELQMERMKLTAQLQQSKKTILQLSNGASPTKSTWGSSNMSSSDLSVARSRKRELELVNARSRLQEAERVKASLRAEIQSLSSQANDMQSQLEKMSQDLATAQHQLERRKYESLTSSKEIERQMIEYKRLLNESEERTMRVSSHLARREAAHERLLKEKAYQDIRLAGLSADIEEFDLIRSDLERKVLASEANLFSLQKDRDCLYAQLEEEQLLVRHLNTRESDVALHSEVLQGRLQTAEANIRDLNDKLEASSSQVNRLELDRSELVSKLEESERTRTVYQEEKSSMQAQLDLLQSHLDDSSKQLTALESKVKTAEKDRKLLETEKAGLAKNLEESALPSVVARSSDVEGEDAGEEFNESESSVPSAVARWLETQDSASSYTSLDESSPVVILPKKEYEIWTPPAISSQEHEASESSSESSSDRSWEAPYIAVAEAMGGSARKHATREGHLHPPTWDLPGIPLAASTCLVGSEDAESAAHTLSSSLFEEESVDSIHGSTKNDASDSSLPSVVARWLADNPDMASSQSSFQRSASSIVKSPVLAHPVWTPPTVDNFALDELDTSGSSSYAEESTWEAPDVEVIRTGDRKLKNSSASATGNKPGWDLPDLAVATSTSRIFSQITERAPSPSSIEEESVDAQQDQGQSKLDESESSMPSVVARWLETQGDTSASQTSLQESSSAVQSPARDYKIWTPPVLPAVQLDISASSDASDDDSWDAPNVPAQTQRKSSESLSHAGKQLENRQHVVSPASWDLPHVALATSTIRTATSEMIERSSTSSSKYEVDSFESGKEGALTCLEESASSLPSAVARFLETQSAASSSAATTQDSSSLKSPGASYQIWTPPALSFDAKASPSSVVTDDSGGDHSNDKPEDTSDNSLPSAVARWLENQSPTSTAPKDKADSSSTIQSPIAKYKVWTPPNLPFESIPNDANLESDSESDDGSHWDPPDIPIGGNAESTLLSTGYLKQSIPVQLASTWEVPDVPIASATAFTNPTAVDDSAVSASSSFERASDDASTGRAKVEETAEIIERRLSDVIVGGVENQSLASSLSTFQDSTTRLQSPGAPRNILTIQNRVFRAPEMASGIEPKDMETSQSSVPSAVARWLQTQGGDSPSTQSSLQQSSPIRTHNIWTPPALPLGYDTNSEASASKSSNVARMAEDLEQSHSSVPSAVARWLETHDMGSTASSQTSLQEQSPIRTHKVWTPPALTFDEDHDGSTDDGDSDSDDDSWGPPSHKPIVESNAGKSTTSLPLPRTSEVKATISTSWDLPDVPLVASTLFTGIEAVERSPSPVASSASSAFELESVESASLEERKAALEESNDSMSSAVARWLENQDTTSSPSASLQDSSSLKSPVTTYKIWTAPELEHNTPSSVQELSDSALLRNDLALSPLHRVQDQDLTNVAVMKPEEKDSSSRALESSEASLPSAVARWLENQSATLQGSSSTIQSPVGGFTPKIWTPPILPIDALAVEVDRCDPPSSQVDDTGPPTHGRELTGSLSGEAVALEPHYHYEEEREHRDANIQEGVRSPIPHTNKDVGYHGHAPQSQEETIEQLSSSGQLWHDSRTSSPSSDEFFDCESVGSLQDFGSGSNSCQNGSSSVLVSHGSFTTNEQIEIPVGARDYVDLLREAAAGLPEGFVSELVSETHSHDADAAET